MLAHSEKAAHVLQKYTLTQPNTVTHEHTHKRFLSPCCIAGYRGDQVQASRATSTRTHIHTHAHAHGRFLSPCCIAGYRGDQGQASRTTQQRAPIPRSQVIAMQVARLASWQGTQQQESRPSSPESPPAQAISPAADHRQFSLDMPVRASALDSGEGLVETTGGQDLK